jgi:hypothetical protein
MSRGLDGGDAGMSRPESTAHARASLVGVGGAGIRPAGAAGQGRA